MKNQNRWVPPERLDSNQLSLLPVTLQAPCDEAKISPSDLSAWSDKGLVSYDPARENLFQPQEVAEVHFIVALMRSGLSEPSMNGLLARL